MYYVHINREKMLTALRNFLTRRTIFAKIRKQLLCQVLKISKGNVRTHKIPHVISFQWGILHSSSTNWLRSQHTLHSGAHLEPETLQRESWRAFARSNPCSYLLVPCISSFAGPETYVLLDLHALFRAKFRGSVPFCLRFTLGI